MRFSVFSPHRSSDSRDDHRRSPMTRNTFTVSLVLMALAAAPLCAQQTSGGLFPEPFLVEHAVTVTEPGGGSFTSEPVVDHFGGSMIVSVRPDGSPLIIDFPRREVTEIKLSSATYTVITFDRFAQLSREYQSLEGPPAVNSTGEDTPEIEFQVSEINPAGSTKMATAKALSTSGGVLDRHGLRRIEVAVATDGESAAEPALEAWVDSNHRFSPRAMDAIEDFELEVLGASAEESGLVPLKAVAMARRHADGAVPLFTARPTLQGGGLIEDVATRIETLDALQIELVSIPEGFSRTAHPLEMMVAHAHREAELRTLMSGSAEGR